LAAAALGTQIYVVGGYDDVVELASCHTYDPAAATWGDCPPLNVPRGGLALAVVREQIYAIGGGMGGRYLAFNERYDARTGTWYPIETPVREQWRGLGLAFLNPNLYAIGGWNGQYLPANEAYQALFQYQFTLP
jgi:hypothetical protein